MENIEWRKDRDGKLGDEVMMVVKNEVIEKVELSADMAEVIDMQILIEEG